MYPPSGSAGRNGAAVAPDAVTAMSSTLTLQSSPLPQVNAMVLVPLVNDTGSVTVAQSSQLDVFGKVTWVAVPFTTRLIVRGAGPPRLPM